MMFHRLAQLLSQLCQFPIRPSRTRQRVEQPKAKSTQPSYPSRCPSQYNVEPKAVLHTSRGVSGHFTALRAHPVHKALSNWARENYLRKQASDLFLSDPDILPRHSIINVRARRRVMPFAIQRDRQRKGRKRNVGWRGIQSALALFALPPPYVINHVAEEKRKRNEGERRKKSCDKEEDDEFDVAK